jgi:hypothetical protein
MKGLLAREHVNRRVLGSTLHPKRKFCLLRRGAWRRETNLFQHSRLPVLGSRGSPEGLASLDSIEPVSRAADGYSDAQTVPS